MNEKAKCSIEHNYLKWNGFRNSLQFAHPVLHLEMTTNEIRKSSIKLNKKMLPECDGPAISQVHFLRLSGNLS